MPAAKRAPSAVVSSRATKDDLNQTNSKLSQYQSLTRSAATVDRNHVGRLMVSGSDALDLLNRLSTNKLDEVTSGHGMGTVLTTKKGRIVDLLFVTNLEDVLLVLTSPGRQKKVSEWIDFYTFGEDVEVRDISDETSMLGIAGPKAAAVVRQVLDMDVDGMALYDSLRSGDRVVVKTDFLGTTAFDILSAYSTTEDVIRLFEDRRLLTVDTDVAEFVRIENRMPCPESDLTEDYNPLEANLLSHVSFNKGCYIGQEVVARLNTYDKVQRHLVALGWESDSALEPGTTLTVGGKNVGAVTSVASATWTDRHAALGYVRTGYVKPGTTLDAATTGYQLTVTVKGPVEKQ